MLLFCYLCDEIEERFSFWLVLLSYREHILNDHDDKDYVLCDNRLSNRSVTLLLWGVHTEDLPPQWVVCNTQTLHYLTTVSFTISWKVESSSLKSMFIMHLALVSKAERL